MLSPYLLLLGTIFSYKNYPSTTEALLAGKPYFNSGNRDLSLEALDTLPYLGTRGVGGEGPPTPSSFIFLLFCTPDYEILEIIDS